MHPTIDVEQPARGHRAAVPSPKVRVPRASTTLVLRPRLLELLSGWGEEDTGPELTFLCAPAGSGKTTLLAEWARGRRRAGEAVAWVSLDSGDNDVNGFWSAVLAAIDASTRWKNGSPVAHLSAPAHGFTAAFLSAFVDAMEEESGPPVHLALDDAHELRDRETLHSLDLLLRSLPSRLKVVVSARFLPALSLPRLRLDGRVLEIEGARLAFTSSEATTLLEQHGVRLGAEDFQVLLGRTEGWAAGLRLAAMSLSRAEDPSALIATFAGDDRAVADYLVGEVLAHQDEPTRQFLLSTSVSDRITADLARELSGREDAGAVLDDLERANSFVVRLGGPDGWYRYHPMLHQYLLAELARQNHEQLQALHRTAAQWFAGRNETMTAIEHAVAGVDADLTASLLQSFGLRHVLRGEGARLRRVLGRAADEVARRPGVALVTAATALEAGDPAAADAALALIPRSGAGERPLLEGLRGLHAFIALQRARLAGDADAATELLAGRPAPTGDADLDLLIQVDRGVTLAWLGDLDAAESDLGRALAVARGTGRDWIALQCLAHLSAVACARSDAPAVRDAAGEAVAIATAHGWTRSTPHAAVALAQGWAAYQRLDDAEVRTVLPTVRRLADSHQPSTALAVAVFQVAVAFDETENRHELVAEAREAWRRLPAGHLPPHLVAGAALVEQRLAFQVGEPSWAADVVERTGRLLGDTGELRVLQAVTQAHRGRTDSARRLLAPVVSGGVSCVVPLTLLEAWIWEARLAARTHEEERAHLAVMEALTIGASHELLRPFGAGGRELYDLLANGAGRFGRLEPFAATLRAVATPPDQESMELLTTRELQLLVELPSLRTAEEIAASMFVSVNTVKTHLRGIYRKLGVGNRREAIVLARRRGLI